MFGHTILIPSHFSNFSLFREIDTCLILPDLRNCPTFPLCPKLPAPPIPYLLMKGSGFVVCINSSRFSFFLKCMVNTVIAWKAVTNLMSSCETI